MERLRNLFKKPRINSEAGTNTTYSGYVATNIKTRTDLDKEEYDEMLESDAVVKGLINIFRATVLSLNWTIEGGSDEARQLVDDNFRKPPELGGMELSMRKVISHMLTARVYGWSPFEKVFTILGGNILLKKLAPRSVYNYEIVKNSKGGFNGLKQIEPETTIGINNSFVFTLGDGLYGKSSLTTLYSYWYRKQQLNRLDDIAAEKYTVPPEILMMPSNTQDDERRQVAQGIQKKKANAVIGLPGSESEGYKLEALNPTLNPNIQRVEWCNLEMARAMGMQFFMLINIGASTATGSYALSKDQSTLFVNEVRDVAAEIEEAINKDIIPQLVMLNFPDTTELPRFKFSPVQDDNTLDFIKTLISSNINSSLSDVLNKAAARVLGEDIDNTNDTNIE